MSYSQVQEKLQSAKRVLIGSHYNPDADAIGSTLALATVLRALGKSVVSFNRDKVPHNLSFLAGSETVVNSLSEDDFDLVIMVDCAHLKRVGGDFNRDHGDATIMCIDHHILDETDASVNLIESGAASTSEIVFKVLEGLTDKISKEVAEHIYSGLAGDTGFFHHNTSAEIFRFAAKLADLGADAWKIAKEMEGYNPLERFHLHGLALQTIEFDKESYYSSMDVTLKMLEQAGATADLAEEFAHYPRSISGVKVSAFFRELEPGKVKISLRSKGALDVAVITKSLGGGGHANAAGCTMDKPLAEAKQLIKSVVVEKLNSNTTS